VCVHVPVIVKCCRGDVFGATIAIFHNASKDQLSTSEPNVTTHDAQRISAGFVFLAFSSTRALLRIEPLKMKNQQM
jgi:hypothetical protein